MLDQSVNLFQERFKEKQLALSAGHMLLISSIIFVGLLISSFWHSAQLDQIETKNQVLFSQKERLSQQLKQQQEKLDSQLADVKIDEMLNQVTMDIGIRKKMIDFVENNQFGSGRGFSDNLTGLSDIQLKDVWLNEIALSDNYIKLTGSSINPEKVPEYFNQFISRQLFNGQEFDVFELSRPQQRNWKVDFVIASKADANE